MALPSSTSSSSFPERKNSLFPGIDDVTKVYPYDACFYDEADQMCLANAKSNVESLRIYSVFASNVIRDIFEKTRAFLLKKAVKSPQGSSDVQVKISKSSFIEPKVLNAFAPYLEKEFYCYALTKDTVDSAEMLLHGIGGDKGEETVELYDLVLRVKNVAKYFPEIQALWDSKWKEICQNVALTAFSSLHDLQSSESSNPVAFFLIQRIQEYRDIHSSSEWTNDPWFRVYSLLSQAKEHWQKLEKQQFPCFELAKSGQQPKKTSVLTKSAPLGSSSVFDTPAANKTVPLSIQSLARSASPSLSATTHPHSSQSSFAFFM